ncbi:MAG: aspartate kinase [Deltaproteobacteria bacterium]|nr:aspartate kinase [Candidatus Zymogenaceae bacterium]
MDSQTQPIVVHKYGGSSVADPDKLKQVAKRIIAEKRLNKRIVVVVSAMGDTTDQLLSLAKEMVATPTARELDMLLSVGERISMTLLSMALNEMGHPAKSFTGSQSGIITDTRHSNARIVEVRPRRIVEALQSGLIAIVAGYQGVSIENEVTTLGRGGSDTTAVALAAALGAEYLEICSDVDGVLSTDPRIVTDARKIDRLSFDEMQEMAAAGARVLNTTAVEYAKRAGITIRSVSTFGTGGGTVVGDFYEETRTGLVRAVVFERELTYVVSDDLFSRQEITGLMDFLDDEAADYKQFDLKTYGGQGFSFSFILSLENVHGYRGMKERLGSRFPKRILFFEEWGALSLIGEGINNTGQNVKKTISLLSSRGIPVHDVHTSRFRISALVDRAAIDEAVRVCHDAFIAGK